MSIKRLLATAVLAGLLAALVVARRPGISPVRTLSLAGTPFTMVFDDHTNRLFVARLDAARQADFILEVRASRSGRLLRSLTLPGSPVALATHSPPDVAVPDTASDETRPATPRFAKGSRQTGTSPYGVRLSRSRHRPFHPVAVRGSITSEGRNPHGALLVLSAGPTSGALTVLDAASGAIRYAIPFFQPKTLAMDQQRGVALVGDALNATITVVDVTTGRRLRTISTECCPTALGIDEQSGRAVVIDRVAFGLDGSASVVDPRRGAILGTFPMDLLSDALLIDQHHGLALINGGFPNGDNMSLLDIRHAGPARTIPVGAGPNTMALDPRGGLAAVSNGVASTLTLIETRSGKSVTVPVGTNPDLMAAAGDALLVMGQPYSAALGERNTGWLRVLGTHGQPAAAEAIMTNPTAAAVDVIRGLVLVAGSGPVTPNSLPYGPGEVWLLDARTGTLRKRLDVGVNPRQIVVDEQAGVAYVLNAGGEFTPPPMDSWIPAWLRGWLPTARATRLASSSLSILKLSDLHS